MPIPTGIGGELFGTDHEVDWLAASDYEWSSELRLRPRHGAAPTVDGVTPGAWSGLLRILPGDTAPADRLAWREEALRLCTPHRNRKRTIMAEYRGLDLEADAYITLARHPAGVPMDADRDAILHFNVVIPEAVWRDTTPNGPSASPLVMGGNYPAQPRLTISPDGSAVMNRVRINFADSQRGRGFQNYLLLISGIDFTGVGATDPTHYLAFFNNKPHPIYVIGPNTATGKLWTRITIPNGGVAADTYIDLFFGSDIDNEVTSNARFERGGVDLENAACSLTHYVINDLRVAIFPETPWSLVPVRRGTRHEEVSFGLTQQGATAIKDQFFNTLTFSFGPSGQYNNDYNGVAISFGGAEAVAVNALTNLDAVASETNGGIIRIRSDYRIADSPVWQTSESDAAESPASGTLSATQDIDGATEWCAWASGEPDSGGAGPVGTFVIDVATPLEVDLDPDTVPVVTVGTPVAAQRLQGTITHDTSGDEISIDVYMDEVDLTIDTRLRTIEAASGPAPYTSHKDGGIRFSNEVLLFPLIEGASNAWTDAGNFTSEIEASDTYMI